MVPLVRRGQRWIADCTKAQAVLVPLLSIGCRVIATPASGTQPAGTFSMGAPAVLAGGPTLSETALDTSMFEAAAMSDVKVDLMEMKVAELKQELEARGEGRTGNKAWLRRRIHAACVRSHLTQEDDVCLLFDNKIFISETREKI